MGMKSKLLVLTLWSLCAVAVSQTVNDYDVIKLDTTSSHRAYRSGQLLVKFKDSSALKVRGNAGGRVRADRKEVQTLLDKYGVEGMEQLMPTGGAAKTRAMAPIRSITGKILEDRDMTKLYLLKLDQKQLVKEVVEAFEQLDEVEFAEPNYLVHALGTPFALPQFTEYQPTRGTRASVNFNDPYLPNQWGTSAINLPALWAIQADNVLGRRPVIAILDTGVDIEHPDLKSNIWTNEKEANGADGEDDDMNGYVDDLHGWDCVNQIGRLGDWNGHGTHCAGIAAAVTNNGVGVVGANNLQWKAVQQVLLSLQCYCGCRRQ